MIKFTVVPSTLIGPLWPQFEHYLAPVAEVSSGELTLESIKKNMEEEKCVVVAVLKDTKIIGVNTLEVHTFDSNLKTLYIPIISGEGIAERGMQFFDLCKDLAKQAGCTELRGLAARDGWMRKLKQHDLHWEKCYEVIRYDLT